MTKIIALFLVALFLAGCASHEYAAPIAINSWCQSYADSFPHWGHSMSQEYDDCMAANGYAAVKP